MWRNRLFSRPVPSRTLPTRRARWSHEHLETRLLLSADLGPVDEVLEILGTAGNDSMLIRTIEPETDTPQLVVTLNGETTTHTFKPGQTIRVDLLGGNDALDAQLDAAADWDIRLGDGDDRVNVNADSKDPLTNFLFGMKISAGSGDDQVAMKYTLFLDAGEPVRGTLFDLDLATDEGDDTVDFQAEIIDATEIAGESSAMIDVALDFGAGATSVEARVIYSKLALRSGFPAVEEASLDLIVGTDGPVLDHPDLYMNIWINQGEIPSALPESVADVLAGISLEEASQDANSSCWIRVSQLPTGGGMAVSLDADSLLNAASTAALQVRGSDHTDNVRAGIEGFANVSVDVETHGGNDSIWIDIGAPLMSRALLDAGGGDDDVSLSVHDGTSNTILVAEKFGGAGDDQLRLAIEGEFAEIDVTTDSGDGDDEIDIEALLGDETLNSRLKVDAGRGNDAVRINLLLPAVRPVGDARSEIVGIDLGEGENSLALKILSSPPPDDGKPAEFRPAEFRVTDGSGPSTVDLLVDGKLTDFTADLGDGDNELVMNVVGPVPGLTFDVRTGLGHNLFDQTARINDSDKFEQYDYPGAYAGRFDGSDKGDTVHIDWLDNLQRLDFDLDIRLGQANSRSEAEDEIAIAFIHGDANAHVDIGMLWNSGDNPPDGVEALPREAHLGVIDDGDRSLPAVQVNVRGWDFKSKDELTLEFEGALADLDVVAALGDGDDVVDIDATGARFFPADTTNPANIFIDLGPGDDAAMFELPAVQRGPGPVLQSTITGGDGFDRLDLVTGDADDLLEIETLTGEAPGVQLRADSPDISIPYSWTYSLLPYIEQDNIYSGAGKDLVVVNFGLTPKPLPELSLVTGDGDDTIDASIVGVSASVVLNMDTGDGDDTVDVNVAGPIDIVTGAGSGAPQVKAFTGATSAETQSFFAYDPSFTGGVRVASGDVNGDGVADIITGAGPGGGPHVKVFDGRSQAEIASFFAYGPTFTGGVFVAAGDVNGDGFADVITGAGSGSGPHVKVFDGRNNVEIRSFFAYGPTFTGGVRVAAGDVNGDGIADIVTGAGPGAGPHIKVFDGRTNSEIRSFFAYDPAFRGGIYVAAGDINGDGFDDIVTGADAGAPAHVKVFSGATAVTLRSFLAFDASFTGGVRVAAGDVNGDGFADIVTGAGPGAGPHVRVFDGAGGALLRSFFAYDPSSFVPVHVAVGDWDGDNTKPPVFDLDLAAGAGDDHAALTFITGRSRTDSIRADMGAGADSFVLNWQGALQDPAVDLQAIVNVDPGGAEALPGADDLVQLTFMNGDPVRPAIYNWAWLVRRPRPGVASLLVDISSVEGILDVSTVLKGGSAADSVRLTFEGKIRAGSNPQSAPPVRALLDMGNGDDQVEIDFSKLSVEGSGKGTPIALDVLGGAGNNTLIVTTTPGADSLAITANQIVLEGAGLLDYNAFQFIEVNTLGGNDTVTMTGINPGTMTTIDGGAGRDRFIGRFGPGDVGRLNLLNFELTTIIGGNVTIGPVAVRLVSEQDKEDDMLTD